MTSSIFLDENSVHSLGFQEVEDKKEKNSKIDRVCDKINQNYGKQTRVVMKNLNTSVGVNIVNCLQQQKLVLSISRGLIFIDYSKAHENLKKMDSVSWIWNIGENCIAST